MIRGNHEDEKITAMYGFKDECGVKLQELAYDTKSCYNAITRVFDYLPFAAVIRTPKDKIFCSHGGLSQQKDFKIE